MMVGRMTRTQHAARMVGPWFWVLTSAEEEDMMPEGRKGVNGVKRDREQP